MCVGGGGGQALSPVYNFFVRTGKLGVTCCDQFATDCYETPRIY